MEKAETKQNKTKPDLSPKVGAQPGQFSASVRPCLKIMSKSQSVGPGSLCPLVCMSLPDVGAVLLVPGSPRGNLNHARAEAGDTDPLFTGRGVTSTPPSQWLKVKARVEGHARMLFIGLLGDCPGVRLTPMLQELFLNQTQQKPPRPFWERREGLGQERPQGFNKILKVVSQGSKQKWCWLGFTAPGVKPRAFLWGYVPGPFFMFLF